MFWPCHPLGLWNSQSTTIPTRCTFHKLLYPGPQHRLMQTKIIHGPHSQDTLPLKRRSDPVHQAPARLTKVIRHRVVFHWSSGLGEYCEILLTTDVAKRGVKNGEVCGSHGGGDFMAIGTVTDEGVDEAGCL